MPKIRGKFAPLFTELGEDYRWLMQLNDRQKFIYILILITIYECNNVAPEDANYYRRRYNLGARTYRVRSDIEAIKHHFPKLIAKDKKLSLLNYKGYENRVADDLPKNKKENKKEKENYSSEFLSFWSLYPRKEGKGFAYTAFKRSVLSEGVLAQIVVALERQKKSEQ